jgi:hypothetical protein
MIQPECQPDEEDYLARWIMEKRGQTTLQTLLRLLRLILLMLRMMNGLLL